ncbi:MAG: hypothetical protein K0R31_1102 [Clostridiales bacterium]|jgi:hypothetical protein|nr:hypothetical protein [Clostridiales bacterium]
MSERLRLAVKMALIPEISKQNYDTLAKQFREVVANAFDAEASLINITVRQIGSGGNAKLDLVFEDDGFGMTAEEFKMEYLGVGGSQKADDVDTIGRIGIGSLAVAVLSPRLRVESRKSGSDKVLVANLNIGEVVRGIDKSVEVHAIDIGSLDERSAREEEPERYTRITLQGVYDDTAKILQDKDKMRKVIRELKKTLPLRYPDEHPLLEKLSADLKEVLLDKNRLRTIEVILSIPCLGAPGLQLERYTHGHPSQESERIAGYPYHITPIIVPNGINPNLTVFGYFVDAGGQLPPENRGFVVRVKNMGVELNSFFEYNDAAANARVTGEIFIENLDEQNAMTINRNELVKEHPDYLAICRALEHDLRRFIQQEVRKRVSTNADIKKKIDRIKGVRTALRDIGQALGELDVIAERPVQKELSLQDKLDVDEEQEIRDLDSSIVVYPLDTISQEYDISHEDDEIIVTIRSDLLANTVEINGEEYTFYLKQGNESESLCEIDLNEKTIYLNVGHPILISRGNQIIKAVIALRFAYLQANGDADQLYDTTLQILGAAF